MSLPINIEYRPYQQYLFNRKWSVALGAPNQTAAVEYTQLRVAFDIDKLGLGTSSKAKITIYNLSQLSRQKIQKGWVVQLKAGYNDPNNLATIFLGVVGPNGAYAKRDGADILTILECGDGEAALVLGTLDKSYQAGTSLYHVLQDAAKSSGLGIGTVTGIPSVTFSKGYTAHGSIKNTLDDLCKKMGLAWHVNNGNISIIPIKGYDGQVADVVSIETGLIGTPSMDNQVLKFDTLLNPKIAPGTVVQMISQNDKLNGFYKVNRTHLEGDSHDSKWGMSVEAILFPNVRVTTPVAKAGNFATAVT